MIQNRLDYRHPRGTRGCCCYFNIKKALSRLVFTSDGSRREPYALVKTARHKQKQKQKKKEKFPSASASVASKNQPSELRALRTCVYIKIRQLSSFRAPTLSLIHLTGTTCHIQHTFLCLCQKKKKENIQNTKILKDHHFRLTQKWPPTVTTRRCAKLLY